MDLSKKLLKAPKAVSVQFKAEKAAL